VAFDWSIASRISSFHEYWAVDFVLGSAGKKFNNNKQALRDLRDFNDDVCREHGLSVPEKDTY
jgi:uncharacterized protein (UPF0548 family)